MHIYGINRIMYTYVPVYALTMQWYQDISINRLKRSNRLAQEVNARIGIRYPARAHQHSRPVVHPVQHRSSGNYPNMTAAKAVQVNPIAIPIHGV